MVTLEPLTDANRASAKALRVAPSQERFVSTVAESLREAAEHPDARPICWVIHAEAVPVGFAMIADDVGSPEYIPHFLWKLLIDQHHQHRGHGTAALDVIVDHFRTHSTAEALTTSAHPGAGSPIPFYERDGFVRTGELNGDQELLRLPLAH
ncbi:GNAT family N-acetyltransferase [Baekduia sp. Peel2402]|uniref:GNAT family N-acetyltransferase n=1 Tax=Baekduia sp. Peel2402 TaxID=3458296 RepID=UPI00403EAE33